MKQLIQYVRRRSKPVGCVVAIRDDQGQIHLGWSLCYHGKLNPETGRREGGDTFSKKQATQRALDRAKAGRIPWPPDHHRKTWSASLDELDEANSYWDNRIPQTVDKPLQQLHERAVRYWSKKDDSQK